MSGKGRGLDNFVILGVVDENCQRAIERAMGAITRRLPNNGVELLSGVRVSIGHNLTKSGGEADIVKKTVVLDTNKNVLSLQEVEDLLVKEGILAPDDWTVVLPEAKDEPRSTLSYNLVHELGHLLNSDLSAELAPTRYGQTEEGEAFPEAFTYWIYGKPISPEAEKVIKYTISNHRGEL